MSIFFIVVGIIVCVGLYVINESIQSGIQRDSDFNNKIDELINLTKKNHTSLVNINLLSDGLPNMNNELIKIQGDIESIERKLNE